MAWWHRSAFIPSITFSLLTVSAGVNVLQAQRIHVLVSPVPNTPAAIGRRAGVVEGFSLSGSTRQVTLAGSIPTVLYFFSPTCVWCERNWANVKALAAGATGRYRILMVTGARSVDTYLRDRGLTVDIIEGISETTRRDLGLTATPQTVVVSAEGLISHVWSGPFTARPKRQIEQLFDVSLPGLVENALENRTGGR